MNSSGRAIKGAATALAIFIICLVISAICVAGMGVARLVGIWDTWEWREAPTDLSEMEGADWADWTPAEVRRNLKVLEVDVKAAAVRLVEADEFRVETNNARMTQRYENGRLQLIEESFDFWNDEWESELVIYWPHDLKLEEFTLSTGAAQVQLGEIAAQEVKLNLGAGRAEIAKLTATKRAEINGGAGVLEISDGELNDLDLDMGVGRMTLNARLTGNNKINAGLGRLEIGLQGEPEDYTIKVNKGLGAIRLDGQELQDEQIYGQGAARVEIDGGVGAIEVRFK